MDHSICHIEIPTTDLAKATKFYQELFGWKIEMWPGSEYAVFDTGKEPGGGIMKVDKVFPPEGMGITFYVLVESIEDTLSKAEKLGGRLVKEKSAVSDMGWFGLFSDLDGNVIGIWKVKNNKNSPAV